MNAADCAASPANPALLDALARRRSVPPQDLAGPGPNGEELERLLTVAARVPDHGRLAPFRFIVFEGDARAAAGRVIAARFRDTRPDATEAMLAVEAARLSRAPLVVAVVSTAAAHPKIPEWEQVLCAGAVCMSLVAAATAAGYGANWLTNWFSYDEAVLRQFGVREGERVAGFVHIGRASVTPADRPRPDVAAITTRFDAPSPTVQSPRL